MALSIEDIKVGDLVVVSGFTGTVNTPRDTGVMGCTRLTDNDGNVSFVYRSKLENPVPPEPPYIDGQTYISNRNILYVYKAGTPRGTWARLDSIQADIRRPYPAPVRPMRAVTLGEKLND